MAVAFMVPLRPGQAGHGDLSEMLMYLDFASVCVPGGHHM